MSLLCCCRVHKHALTAGTVLAAPAEDSDSEEDSWCTAFESDDDETREDAVPLKLRLFRGADFARGEPNRMLEHLLRVLYQARHAAAEEQPELRCDPMVYPKGRLQESVLVARYLIAEDWDLDAAERRLRATLEWRARFKMSEFYTNRGSGSVVMLAAGAEMYFADGGFTDREGRPTMVGRLKMCNAHAMHPYNHIVAAVYVCERLAAATTGCDTHDACYILDIGDIDFTASYSATGGKHAITEGPSLADAGASTDPPKGREWLFDQYGELQPGLSVLRCALDLLNKHYPELLDKILFVNAGWLFRAAFAVFSLWVSERTRKKFKFVTEMRDLEEFYELGELPPEFGGSGVPLDKDGFIARAVQRYDLVEEDLLL